MHDRRSEKCKRMCRGALTIEPFPPAAQPSHALPHPVTKSKGAMLRVPPFIVLLALLALLTLLLAACDDEPAPTPDGPTAAAAPTATSTPEPAPDPTATPTPEPAPAILLTDNSADDWFSSWSPDGSRIAFAT